MKASEARKILEQNGQTLEVILSMIKHSTESGIFYCNVYNYVDKSVEHELMKLGYSIKYVEDKNMATIFLQITW